MKLRRRRRHAGFLGNALTPLLDILFLLLIFLLLAANFDERQLLQVELAKVGGDVTPRSEFEAWTIVLAEDGTLTLDGRGHDRDSLREAMQALPPEERLRTVVIQGDARVDLGEGLALLKMLERIGFLHCSFQVGPPSHEE